MVVQEQWSGVNPLKCYYSQGPGPRPTTQFTLAEEEDCHWPCHKSAALVPIPPAVQISPLKTNYVCILAAEIVWGFVISALWSQRNKFLHNFAFSSAKGTTLCCAVRKLEDKTVFKEISPGFSMLHSSKLSMTSCFCHSSYYENLRLPSATSFASFQGMASVYTWIIHPEGRALSDVVHRA